MSILAYKQADNIMYKKSQSEKSRLQITNGHTLATRLLS